MPLTEDQRAALPPDLGHFTNRHEQLAAFEQLWPAGGPILAFEGMSGSGKSTLIRVLIAAYCQPQQMPYTYIDFDDPGGAQFRQSAEDLCSALVLSYTLQLPPFVHEDFKTRRNQALVRLAQRKAEINVTQSTTASHSGEISHSGQTAQLNLAETMLIFEREARAEIGQAALDAFGSYAERPCLIFLDTFERLMEDADAHHRDWLWGWLTQAIQRYPRLRLVIGGRQPLRLARSQGRELNLPDLSAADSDVLLAYLGVTDPAWRRAIYERLAGGHPLATEMAGDLWRESAQSPLPISDIPRLAGHEKAIDWLTGKILERLAEPLRSAVRWAALLRAFTPAILRATLPPDLPPLTEAHFGQLRGFSFVQPASRAPGHYACHSLLRRVQSYYLGQTYLEEFRAFHQRAADYFAGQERPIESLYHRLATAEDGAFEDWNRAVNQAKFNWDWPAWGELLDLADSPELRLPLVQQGRILEKRGWWRYRQGDLQMALDAYVQAIKLLRQTGDEEALGYTYNNIGLIHDARGDYDQALAWYEKSVAIQEKLGDQSGLATSYNNIGLIHKARGDYDQALAWYQKSVAIQEKLGDQSGLATSYNNIGLIHKARGDYDQALDWYQKSVAIKEKLGDQSGLATSYNNIAFI
ncbi:MAG: tetratricopeptide repeat protein, partial [Chloroflexi bacterium]|nr:tetratricopeptide repeat protein [Chloroflexota bacterium]